MCRPAWRVGSSRRQEFQVCLKADGAFKWPRTRRSEPLRRSLLGWPPGWPPSRRSRRLSAGPAPAQQPGGRKKRQVQVRKEALRHRKDTRLVTQHLLSVASRWSCFSDEPPGFTVAFAAVTLLWTAAANGSKVDGRKCMSAEVTEAITQRDGGLREEEIKQSDGWRESWQEVGFAFLFFSKLTGRLCAGQSQVLSRLPPKKQKKKNSFRN